MLAAVLTVVAVMTCVFAPSLPLVPLILLVPPLGCCQLLQILPPIHELCFSSTCDKYCGHSYRRRSLIPSAPFSVPRYMYMIYIYIYICIYIISIMICVYIYIYIYIYVYICVPHTRVPRTPSQPSDASHPCIMI